MAAIKHIRSAEALILQASNELSYAADAGSKDHQYLMKCVVRDLRIELDAIRDRVNRLKQAQEQDEARDPRINPLASAEHIVLKMSLPGKVGMTFLNCTATIAAEDLDQGKEIMKRLSDLLDGKHSGLSGAVVSIQHVTPKNPGA